MKGVKNGCNSMIESMNKKQKVSNEFENDCRNEQDESLTGVKDNTRRPDAGNDALSLFTLHKMSKRMCGEESNNERNRNELFGIAYEDFRSIYKKYQAIYIPNVSKSSMSSSSSSTSKKEDKNKCVSSNELMPNDLYSIFKSLDKKDQDSWCVENELKSSTNLDENKDQTISTNPGEFLQSISQSCFNGESKSECLKRRQGYCSFIIQNDKQMLNNVLDRVPQAHLPIFSPTLSKCENSDKVKSNHEETMKIGDTQKATTTLNSKINTNANDVETSSSKILLGEDSLKPNVEHHLEQEYLKSKYGPCLWFFYGLNDPMQQSQDSISNNSTTYSALQGRPEHTDSISHDGTWHYQLSGRKTWYIRPTDTLIRKIQEQNENNPSHEIKYAANTHTKHNAKNTSIKQYFTRNSDAIQIDCRKGDILLLNTRLWWHKTELPIQEPLLSIMNESNDTSKVKKDVIFGGAPSVSYARDIFLPSSFWLESKQEKTNDIEKTGNDDTNDKINENNDAMTNIDGLYAANDIEAQTILFTEADMPNCELHRSKTNANCEVVELEDGSSAVVSIKPISCGEFFCVQESSDEDEDEYEDEDDEEVDRTICIKCP